MRRLASPLFLCAADSPTVRCSCVCPTSLNLRSLFREGAVDAATFWPFAHNTRELVASTGLDDPTIFPFSYDVVQTPPICTYLSSLPKLSTFPVQFRGCFLSHTLSHSDSAPVYTDWSKSEDGVGCSAAFPHTTLRGSLPPSASTYTARSCLPSTLLCSVFKRPLSSPNSQAPPRPSHLKEDYYVLLGAKSCRHPW